MQIDRVPLSRAEGPAMTQPLSNFQTRDIEALLHPYTDAVALRQSGALVIERGEGVRVFDQSGRGYIDGLAGLWCCGLDELSVAEAEAGAPEAGHRLDIGLAGLVEDPDALAALDNHRASRAQRHGVSVGMQQRLGVAHLEVGERPGHRAPAGREDRATLCDRRRERQSAALASTGRSLDGPARRALTRGDRRRFPVGFL